MTPWERYLVLYERCQKARRCGREAFDVAYREALWAWRAYRDDQHARGLPARLSPWDGSVIAPPSPTSGAQRERQGG